MSFDCVNVYLVLANVSIHQLKKKNKFCNQFESFITDSFHSLPTSYQLLTPPKESSHEFNFNCGRDRVLSPLLRTYPYTQYWQQSPSSDSNLPRFRRDVMRNNTIIETPTAEVNHSSSESNASRENTQSCNQESVC